MDKELINLLNLPKGIIEMNLSVSDYLAYIEVEANKVNVSLSEIKKIVSDSPSIKQSWKTYCENKRITEGWYLKKSLNKWEVGYMDDEGQQIPSQIKDENNAYSIYIYCELAEIILNR
jgi:hypothetical protein